MRSFHLLAAAAAIAGLSSAAPAYVTVHVETSVAAQSRIAPGAFEEDFDAASGSPFLSGFGGSGVSGAFAGVSLATDGAFGASPHAVVTDSATLKLDRMVKYFGYRAAELDGSNTVELFSNGTSLGFFNLVDSAERAGFVGSAIGSAVQQMLAPGQASFADAGNFTYVNFFSTTAFDEIRFTQSGGSFAFDNVRVANVQPVPEPATWGMMILGFGVAGVALRRRAKGVRFAW